MFKSKYKAGEKVECIKDISTFVKGRQYKVLTFVNVNHENHIILYRYNKLGNDHGEIFLESEFEKYFKKL